MRKFINILCCIILVFGVWLPFVLKLFQHCGVHCGHHLQSECEVWEASQLGIRVGLWLWSIVLPSGMEPHGLEDLEEKSGCHFFAEF